MKYKDREILEHGAIRICAYSVGDSDGWTCRYTTQCSSDCKKYVRDEKYGVGNEPTNRNIQGFSKKEPSTDMLSFYRIARCYDCDYEIISHYRTCQRCPRGDVQYKYIRTKDIETCPFGKPVPETEAEALQAMKKRVLAVEGIGDE